MEQVKKMKKRKVFSFIKRSGIALLCFLVLCYAGLHIMNFLFPFPSSLLENNTCSQEIEDFEGKKIMQFLDDQDQWNFPITLEDVSPFFLQAIVSAEDKNFYTHCGIDFFAILRACWGNVSKKRILSGASTITMQVVRLLIPRPRVLSSKIIESFQAWQIEQRLSKNKILEIYINLTPYGGNTTGVEAASRKYFDKSARDLSLAEASLLAGLPQSPSAYRPDRRLAKAMKRRDYVLRRMMEEGNIPKERQKETAMQIPSIKSFSRSFEAVHFCYAIRKELPKTRRVRTTLDLRIQGIARQALQEKLRQYPNKEIENGAIVVLENATGEVRALVGSHDFFAIEDQGQINGASILRSPGSLLKPFVYALAIEKGYITPGSVLMDIPLLFSDYRPWNYDKNFRGAVSASSALSQSLNIPAVLLQKECGTLPLLNFLRSIGFASLQKSAQHYGLSLSLGGCEVSLLEAMQAYSTMARLGSAVPLAFYKKEKPGESTQIISPDSAYLVNEMLKEPGALKANEIYFPSNAPLFSWKTGTSSRNKDAWAVVYNPVYTIGVWMGNFDARSSASLVGTKSSADVACQIFFELMRSQKATWYERPSTLKTRRICSVSGGLPIPEICKETIEDMYIPGKSQERLCHVHAKTQIDSSTGYVLCPFCLNPHARSKIVEKWPPDVHEWLKQRGNLNLLPEHNPLCKNRPAQETLTIHSPKNNAKYILKTPQEQQHIFLEAKCTSSKKLYWFVDSVFFQEGDSGTKILYTLNKGEHHFLCVDEQGNKNSVTIYVE